MQHQMSFNSGLIQESPYLKLRLSEIAKRLKMKGVG
jgi:hypothetical protein